MLARRVFYLVVIGLLAATTVQAKDQPCVDGVDCLCDRVNDPSDPIYDPNILMCEDFEDPNLPNRGSQAVWTQKYSVGNGVCLYNPNPGSGTAYTRFGRGIDDCVDIVREGDCDVAGENDCVFEGSFALGHRMRKNKTGGIIGTARFNRSSRFGMTMAIRWSPNYLGPGFPGCASTPEGTCGPAHKMNEFGDTKSPLVGASVSSGVGRNHPFGGSVFTVGSPATNVNLGQIVVNSSGRTRMAPEPSVYEWGRNMNVGQWACLQMHWDNWGTANTRMRYWFNGTPMIDGTTDTRSMYQGSDTSGIHSMAFNNYYNGADGTRSGYVGSTVAYRYEDNIVMTSGPQPVSCEAIGLASGGGGGGPGPVQPPAAPELLPD